MDGMQNWTGLGRTNPSGYALLDVHWDAWVSSRKSNCPFGSNTESKNICGDMRRWKSY